jgi:hypothetical protein
VFVGVRVGVADGGLVEVGVGVAHEPPRNS